MPKPQKLLLPLLAAFCLLLLAAQCASALSFSTCMEDPGFSCSTLEVPLSRAGLAPGTISLSLQRLQAGLTPSRSAVIALAGGPGQAANPLADFMAKAMAPALYGRDLVVFDQRGTGRSNPLSCNVLNNVKALEEASTSAASKIGEQCALELGPARGAFTSQESVEDIEAIRQTLGYEKLVLYGTSYGTKVAELYAERYPQNVEALVLDSVVLPEGPETFNLSTFSAIAGMMNELCSGGACAGITSSPQGDLMRLAALLRTHPLSGSVYDGQGHRHSISIGDVDLLNVLQAGDLNPALRALLPAAIVSALHHEPDPLLRLNALSEGLIPNIPLPPRRTQAEKEASEESDNALFFATSCEEKPLPWQRTADPQTRQAEAMVALQALPASDFTPFDANTAWEDSIAPFCMNWPDASGAPPASSPLPNVPTLIFSGAQDLRTPTSNARQITAQIPDAQLLVVPYTGHSVLGSDFSGCAEEAVEAFFQNATVKPCRSQSNRFAPTPITPTKLAYVKAVPGLKGKSGRTVTAVLDTVVDLSRQVIGATLQADQELPSGASFGGLHGGYAKFVGSAVRLNDFTFVSGVQVTGTLQVRDGELQPATIKISGSAASHGSIRIGNTKSASGTLEGHRFDVNIAKARLSNTGGSWPEHPVLFPLRGLAHIP